MTLRTQNFLVLQVTMCYTESIVTMFIDFVGGTYSCQRFVFRVFLQHTDANLTCCVIFLVFGRNDLIFDVSRRTDQEKLILGCSCPE